MRHTLTVDNGGGLFTVTTEGEGDVAGIGAFLDDIVNHPKWEPGNPILLDHRRLRIDGFTPSGVESVSRHFRAIGSRLGGGKIALVMERAVDFGIARAWEQITADHVDIHIRVFRSLEPARKWLRS